MRHSQDGIRTEDFAFPDLESFDCGHLRFSMAEIRCLLGCGQILLATRYHACIVNRGDAFFLVGFVRVFFAQALGCVIFMGGGTH